MCDGDRDRSDVATDQRNRVLWELGEAGLRPHPPGGTQGVQLCQLRFFISGLQRGTPVFSHWLWYLRKLSEGLSLEGLVHDSKPVCLTSISVSVANTVPSLCSTQSNFCPRGAESLLCWL